MEQDQDLNSEKIPQTTDEEPLKNGTKPILRDERGLFAKGNCAGTGRPPGVKSEAAKIKLAIFNVFRRMGGEEGLLKWAQETKYNRREFYKMLLSILPKEIEIDGDLGNIAPLLIVQFGSLKQSDPIPCQAESTSEQPKQE